MDSAIAERTAVSTAAALQPADALRYGRQLILPEVGVAGQLKLQAARVLVVGAGGLGSPVLMYLAAAGVGTLGIAEHDRVEPSNLHRQVLFDVETLGQPKLDAAARRLQAMNPGVAIEAHATRLVADNAAALIGGYDIVVDATDNFAARYLISDTCVRLGKPNVSASILRFEGQLSVFDAAQGPCYRCLYPAPPPPELALSCAEAGVLGVLPGIFGTLQANEVIKLILGVGEPLVGRVLLFDALTAEFRTLRVDRDPHCPACSGEGGELAVPDAAPACTAPIAAGVPVMSPTDLQRRLASAGAPFVIDVRSAAEHLIAHLPFARLIPLDDLPQRKAEIPGGMPLVAMCHKGSRSRRAVQQLHDDGWRDVFSLDGGIDAWSRDIDPTIPRY